MKPLNLVHPTKIEMRPSSWLSTNTNQVAMKPKINLNSPGTEIFPFSYFAFTLLKLRKVIKDIKNINIFDKTRVHGLEFGRESFCRNHPMTP